MGKDACKLSVPTYQSEADVETESDIQSHPNWLINPGEYEPVLSTTEEHSTAEPTEEKEPVDEELMRRLIHVYTYDGFVEGIFSY